jgi:hypothetical protein
MQRFLATMDGQGESLTFAKDASIIENNMCHAKLRPLWQSVTKIGAYRILAADPETGQVGFIGLV